MKRLSTLALCALLACMCVFAPCAANAIYAPLASIKEAVGNAQFIVRGRVALLEDCTVNDLRPYTFQTDYTYKLVTLEVLECYAGSLPKTIKVVHYYSSTDEGMDWVKPRLGEERIYMLTNERVQFPPDVPVFFCDERSTAVVAGGKVTGDPSVYKSIKTTAQFKSQMAKHKKYVAAWLDNTLPFVGKYASPKAMAQNSQVIVVANIKTIAEKDGLYEARIDPIKGYKSTLETDWTLPVLLPTNVRSGESYLLYLSAHTGNDLNDYYVPVAFEGAVLRIGDAAAASALASLYKLEGLTKADAGGFGKAYSVIKRYNVPILGTGVTVAQQTEYLLEYVKAAKGRAAGHESASVYTFADETGAAVGKKHLLEEGAGGVHCFATGKTLVRYVGNNAKILAALAKQYGQPVAAG